ncbi:MAG: glycerophosphodiester phosphodiesterase family protein [Candidatus Thalassarchaeaceae archaeon]|nr:glycerophosphodiester phosphodiesterase family protein [Candidatus Thalassarchaeaceae archaeon]MDP6844538.1 glycerophosphodiester phosphodiesterase family protein [Candidatus Thalassarchaeaceae archaeon]
MSEDWVKPIENSIDGLRHGMTHLDGVEFDMRLTMDGELVLFHDNHLSKEQVEKIGGSKWTEDHSTSELAELGIETFEQLLADDVFTHSWREHGKVACVELKMPHPNSKIAGSVNPKKREKHARTMAKLADSMLNEVGLQQSNVVFISFKRRFRHACARANVRWPVAQLQPAIPEVGGKRMKRILTMPSFMWLSLAFHLKHQKLVGAPILPCALEYVHGATRHITLGRTFGLTGYTGRRLNRLRKGYQAYVWPTPIAVENSLHQIGLTGMTDDTSPETVTHPGGGARWTRWACQPLDPEREALFQNADPSDHSALIEDAAREVTPWYELTDIERRGFLSIWRKRWNWERDIDELAGDSSPQTMPWEMSRLLGHRGSGKDFR